MTSQTESRWQQLQRAGWMLWAATFAVLLAFAGVVPTLYARVVGLAGREGTVPWLANPAVVTIALALLVIAFGVHTVQQQRELHRALQALSNEEREREDSSVRLSELTALFQMSTSLQLHLRSDVILEIIVRRVISTLKAQQASIMILEPDSGELVTRAAYGLEAEFSRGARKRIGEGIAGWVALRREAVVLGEQPPSTELGQHYKQNRAITSAISLPLTVGDRVIGVLNVNRINHHEPFGPAHLEMLRVFSEHIAAVIDRAEVLDRMDRRTEELEEVNTRLHEVNRMKDVFLGTASHELKTPLTSIMAYAELLEDHEGHLTRKQSREFVSSLRGEAQRLLALIEDILDLSRIESGRLAFHPRPMDFAEVVKGAIDSTQPLIRHYGVRVTSTFAPGLPRLTVDEMKMRQVVEHLIVNAVKFSPQGGTITLNAALDGACVRFEVHDDGPGVPPEQATHLFEMFGHEVSEATQARGGLGIGLHLVKRLSELHGGHVGVNSRPGKGSTFWVRLPVVAAVPVPPAGDAVADDDEEPRLAA